MTGLQDGWVEQFRQFVARKTSLATTALLPPYLTELADPEGHVLAVGNAWSKRLFDGPFYLSPAANSSRPACSLVFVQSADGNTGTADPRLLGGGNTDLHLIYEGLSRVAADAVLAGAGTIRRSEIVFSVWHPELVHLRKSLGLSRHPIQIVATIRGLELDDTLLFNVPEIPVVLLTVASAVQRMQEAATARPWVTLLPMDGPGDLPRAFERLRSMGVARVSCIGGRTLAGRLLDASLIDDVYLTTGLAAGGEPESSLFSSPWRSRTVVRKRGTGVEQGVIFEHLSPDGRQR